MVRTLRITSFLLAASAVCGVVLLALWGLKGDPEIEAFLAEPGIVERLKTEVQVAPDKEDAVSPLVTQAKKFALRIDPPPPPKPDPPPAQTAQRQRPDPKPEPEPERPMRVVPPRPVSVRFDLVATARSHSDPERSFALIKPVVGPSKWYRQGEQIEHLVLHEVNDGSVVLFQDGQRHSEIFVPTPQPRVRSLLKEDATASARSSGPSGVTTAVSQVSEAAADEQDERQAGAAGPIRVARDASRLPSARVDVQGRIDRVRASVREPSPEEKKESLQESIASIQEIMHRDDPHVSSEEQKREQEAWMQLLQLLQKEKTTLEQQTAEDRVEVSDTDASDEEPAGDATPSSENDQ